MRTNDRRTWLGALGPGARGRAAGSQGQGVALMEPAAFGREIEREMLRSDRTSTPLTLVVFDLTGPVGPERNRALERLGEAVGRRARKTDAAGWHRQGRRLRVGLILHHTMPEGAEGLIAEVCKEFEGRGAAGRPIHEIVCEVYAYPAEQKAETGDLEQLWLFDEITLADAQPEESESTQRPIERLVEKLTPVASPLSVIEQS